MKIIYDSGVDVLRIIFNNSEIDESDEDKRGIVFDYDKAGNVVGIEILNASQHVENPQGIDYRIIQNEPKKKAV